MKSSHYLSISLFLILSLVISQPGLSQVSSGDIAPLGSPDGQVNVGDALVALRFALNLEPGHPTSDELSHGDIAPLDYNNQPNPDGQITVGDALVILRVALGLVSLDTASTHGYLGEFTYTLDYTGITITPGGRVNSCEITWVATDPMGRELFYQWEAIEGYGYFNSGENSSTVDYYHFGNGYLELQLTITNGAGDILDVGVIYWDGSTFLEKVPAASISISSLSAVFNGLDVITSFDAPSINSRGITWDGTSLWLVNQTYGSRIYKLDSDGNELDSFSSPGLYAYGLTWDGEYLWVTESGKERIYKISTSGNEIEYFSAPDGWPNGLAWDGKYLWNVGADGDMIYKLDPSGNVIDSFSAPGDYPKGLTWDGTYLWHSDSQGDKIYQLDVNGTIINSFDSPATSPYGLAWDGTYLWNVCLGDNKVYKLNPPGNVTIGSSVSKTFTVKNNGSANLSISTLSLIGKDPSEFSVENDNCSGQTLAPSGSATFDIVFSPTSSGEKKAALEISSNAVSYTHLTLPTN